MTSQATALQPPPLELVVDRSGRQPRLKGWMFFTVVVVAAFMLLIYSRVALDSSAFVLNDLEGQIVTEETRYWELRLQVAEMQSPQRVSRAAEGLGLVYPTERTTLEVAGVEPAGTDIDDRWADLKALLSAQP